MIIFIREFIRELLLTIYSRILGYYTHIDDISIYNWYHVEQGDLTYLYKRIRIKKTPAIFKDILKDMFYQFDKIDPTYFRKIHKLAYLKSLYVTTMNVRYLNDANTLEHRISEDSPKRIIKQSLNEKVNFIESVTHSIGSIDVKKMSASRFYSLLDLAIKKAENGNS